MAQSFIFGGNTNLSYEDVQRKRAIADQLAQANASTPRNVGEGLSAIGRALAYRSLEKRASKADEVNKADAQASISPIIASLFGGGGASYPTAGSTGGGYPTAAPVDPNAPSSIGSATMAALGKPSNDGGWLEYANQGATRNKPLSPELVSALSFLPEMGVKMRVFSGGQDAEGPNRTGSHRHDHGGSGDVFFEKDGRKLDWSNPADQPIFAQIVKEAKARGVTGFGAGDGYMQPGSMHIGFGTPAVWGAGGKGENAPDWLRQAYSGGPAGSAPQGQPQQPQGQPAYNQNNVQAIVDALSNPYVTAGQKAVLQSGLDRMMSQNDPMTQMQMEKARLELDAMKNPQADPMKQLQMEKQRLEIEAMRNPPAKDRKTAADPNGVLRYMDTGEPVYPDVAKTEDDPIAALRARAKEAGLKEGTPEYALFMKDNGTTKDGLVIESDGQGGFRMVQGPGAGAGSPKPFTDAQSKSVAYATRAEGALKALEPIAGALTSRSAIAGDYVPFGLAKGLQSDEYQVAKTAGQEYLQAILRKDTGAAITTDEQALYGETYLPQPGDNEARLAYKSEARQRAIAALKAGMTPAEMIAQEKALAPADAPAAPDAPQGLAVGTVEDGWQFIGGDPAQPESWKKVQP